MDLAFVWPNRQNSYLNTHTDDMEALWDGAEFGPGPMPYFRGD